MWIDKIVDITLDSHDNDNNERVCLFSFFFGFNRNKLTDRIEWWQNNVIKYWQNDNQMVVIDGWYNLYEMLIPLMDDNFYGLMSIYMYIEKN